MELAPSDAILLTSLASSFPIASLLHASLLLGLSILLLQLSFYFFLLQPPPYDYV